MDPMEHPGGYSIGMGRMYDFARWLYERAPGNLPSTHHGYISTIRQRCLAIYGWEFKHCPLLTRYFAKARALPRERLFRDPATRTLVELVMRDPLIHVATRTAVVLAWDGLLRASEYLADPSWRLPSKHKFQLLRQDVEWYCDPSAGVDGMRVKIKRSKSDPLNLGSWQYYQRRPSDPVCPVRAMEIYLAWADTHGALPDAPLFFTSRSASGAFNILTREAVSEALKSCASQSGLNPIYISSHSLRVGGAMQLASRGIALDFIRQRGRWSQLGFSDIALMYTRMDSLRLKAMSSAMGPGPPVGFLPGRI